MKRSMDTDGWGDGLPRQAFKVCVCCSFQSCVQESFTVLSRECSRQTGLASVSALSGNFVYSLPVADSDRHIEISKTRAKSFSAENRPTRALNGGQEMIRSNQKMKGVIIIIMVL